MGGLLCGGDCQTPGGCALPQSCTEVLWPCDVTPLWYLELCRLGMSPGALDMFGGEEELLFLSGSELPIGAIEMDPNLL